MLIALTIIGIILFVSTVFLESKRDIYRPMTLTQEDRAAGIIHKDVILNGLILTTRVDLTFWPKGIFATQVFGTVQTEAGEALGPILTMLNMDQESGLRDFYAILVYSKQYNTMPPETWNKLDARSIDQRADV